MDLVREESGGGALHPQQGAARARRAALNFFRSFRIAGRNERPRTLPSAAVARRRAPRPTKAAFYAGGVGRGACCRS